MEFDVGTFLVLVLPWAFFGWLGWFERAWRARRDNTNAAAAIAAARVALLATPPVDADRDPLAYHRWTTTRQEFASASQRYQTGGNVAPRHERERKP